jgi:hypothetical protein
LFFLLIESAWWAKALLSPGVASAPTRDHLSVVKVLVNRRAKAHKASRRVYEFDFPWARSEFSLSREDRDWSDSTAYLKRDRF